MVNQGDEARGNIHVVLHLDSRVVREGGGGGGLEYSSSKARLTAYRYCFPVAV